MVFIYRPRAIAAVAVGSVGIGIASLHLGPTTLPNSSLTYGKRLPGFW